ncbi:hypothetical protein MJO28_004264 [Puccinia striiformis f. sp. tritici]|uniref:Uncharacterized protein n=2 Tax=Puccinia striiformis TaxID=27350 RepID=A0A2S4VBR2_9BASI|nr:uncharacterized protein Pst134EA_032168 [Puccinia striiformis f. sp. tritici]KAH9441830.1 hypothetical protein Pst134EA_032168 [Puccinia striiformis f. sp. tritici]KAI7957169.1 hypothetical protein MJO28_004264 [Puccinia striiformis f. sp. tritici]KAI7963598.1 hypothetical protein MJO29_004025 [Puccinia striiformis f. sp. tritici]POW06951.1 hypothetical protein PSTT_08631 [Puccinia striiformis]
MAPSSSSPARRPRHVPHDSCDWSERLLMASAWSQKKRQELSYEMFRKPKLIPEMAKLGLAPEHPNPAPNFPPPAPIAIAWRDDELMSVAESYSTGLGDKRDGFKRRAPSEDELTDPDDPDTEARIQREVNVGLPVSRSPHKAHRIAVTLHRNSLVALEILKDLQRQLVKLSDQPNNHPHALKILGFADLIPSRLHLIFHHDGKVTLERTLDAIKGLRKIHLAVDKQKFSALESERKQCLWTDFNQTGEFLEDAVSSLKNLTRQLDLFQASESEVLEEPLLEHMVNCESNADTQSSNLALECSNQLLRSSYTQSARFNYALSELAECVVYFISLFKRANRSIELWKALLISDEVDLSLMSDWSSYWVEVLISSTAGFKSLETNFGE